MASQDKRVEKVIFQLKPAPPFRLDLTVWALRRRPHNLIDCWDGQTYRRRLLIQEQPVEVAVTQTGPPAAPMLRVEAGNLPPHWEMATILTGLLVKMLGLNADLEPFYQLTGQDDRIAPLVERWRGVKPPRFPSVFEALVNGIACQQLSLTVGIHLLNRLASAYGPNSPAEAEPRVTFPRPADLAGLELEALRALGFSRNKGTALIELARGLRDNHEDLENLNNLAEAAVAERLLALRGVGRWTTEYVLLRGLGHWSVFPGDDLGVRRHMQACLKIAEPLNYQEVRRLLARWHPYGGLIYYHFLLNHLAQEGHIS